MSSKKSETFNPFSDEHDAGWESGKGTNSTSHGSSLQGSSGFGSSGFGSSSFNVSKIDDPKRVESLQSTSSSIFSFQPSRRDTKSLQPRTIRNRDSFVVRSDDNAPGEESSPHDKPLEQKASLTPADLERDREMEKKARKKKKKKKRDSLTKTDAIDVEDMAMVAAVQTAEAEPSPERSEFIQSMMTGKTSVSKKDSQSSDENTAMSSTPAVSGRPAANLQPNARSKKKDSYVQRVMTGQKTVELNPEAVLSSDTGPQADQTKPSVSGLKSKSPTAPSVSSRSPVGAIRVVPAPGPNSSTLLPGNQKSLEKGGGGNTPFPDYLMKLGFDGQHSRNFSDELSQNLSETDFKVHPEFASHRRRNIIVGSCVLVIIAAIACGVASLVILNMDSDGQATNPITQQTDQRKYDAEMQELMDKVVQISGSAVFEDKNSPQSLAVRWMVSTDTVWHKSTSIIQRYATVVLYQSFDMLDRQSSLHGWLDGSKHECEWATTLVCDENRVVSKILLPGDDLEGIIPSEIGLLTGLRSLVLNNNTLVGSIPTAVGSLTQLETLVLSHNMLTGSIPPDVGLAQNLREIDLSGNHIHGEIPLSFFRVTNLELLKASSNRIEGTFPNQIGKLHRLKVLELGSNQFRGFLPENLGSLSNLETFKVENNLITGTFPQDKDFLSGLSTLSLSANQIEGRIPDEWDLNRARLHTLRASNNRIKGPLPRAFSEMTTLRVLDVGHNQMTGSVPGFFGTDIEVASLESNRFSGTLSRRIGTNLRYIDFSQNQLEGSVISRIELVRDLQHLDLSSNILTGDIPGEIGQLRSLEHLNLNNCMFTGQIPGALTLLGNLRFLDLDNNLLDGSLPLSLCSNKVPEINFTVPCTAICGCCTQHCIESRQLRAA